MRLVASTLALGVLAFGLVNGNFLNPLQTHSKNVVDLFLRRVITGAVCIKFGVPMDHGAIRPFAFLDPELGVVVLDGKRTFDDLVAVAPVIRLDELFFDRGAVLSRQGAKDGVPLIRLLAICQKWMPRLDRAEVSCNPPYLGWSTRRLDLLVDLET